MKKARVKRQMSDQRILAQANEEKSADAQRRKIAIALGQCMRTTGLAGTTLTDIAVAAGMSPSLMRYYFSTKEEILESYYRLFSDRIITELLKIPRHTPEQWLADFCAFSIGAGTDRASLAVLIETFAVAMHNENLGNLKRRYDSFVIRIYTEFFQWAGTALSIDAHEAAQTARAFELGIKLGAVFQQDFDAKTAETTFLKEMYRLAGMKQPR